GIGFVPRDSALGRALGFIGGPVIMATAALFYRFISRRMDAALRDEREPAPAKATVASTLAFVGLGVLAALLGSLGLGMLMEALCFPVAEQVGILEIIERARAGEATIELAVLTLAAIVLAPVAEEWLFRGLLFRRLRRIGGNAPAYLLSSVGFAAIHWNPARFVVNLWLGLLFAAVIHRTDRLWAPVLVHMGNNAYASTLLIYVPPPLLRLTRPARGPRGARRH